MYLASSGAEIEVQAPAKINLFLEVLERRPDGFHEIETVMVAVSLYDIIRMRPNLTRDVRLSCRWAHGLELFGPARSARLPNFGAASAAPLGVVPATDQNLVVRAVERLRQHANISTGMDIELLKCIPAEAGLGGASSDAAMALQAANIAWKLGWDADRLAALASEIGSDVPFFIGTQQRRWGAICRGRGEQITPLEFPTKLSVVIIKPPVGLSTALVYQNCRPATEPKSPTALIHHLRQGNPHLVGKNLFNRLSETAERLSPHVHHVLNLVRRWNPMGCLMSGSGTSVFTVCQNRQHARRMAAQLRASRIGAVFCAETVPLENIRV